MSTPAAPQAHDGWPDNHVSVLIFEMRADLGVNDFRIRRWRRCR